MDDIDLMQERKEHTDAIAMKTCTRCKEVKPSDAFSKSRQNKDGRAYQCKQCAAAYSAQYTKENREKINANARADYYANREKRITQSLGYAKENREKINAKNRSRYAANRDIARAVNRRMITKVVPCYAARLLGLHSAEISPELLELKRQQLALKRQRLEIHRLSKQLKKELKNVK